MSQGNHERGEGNYRASRDCNERTRRFVESGRVEQAAEDAASPHDPQGTRITDRPADQTSTPAPGEGR